jgi:hypothetical protein
MHNCPTYLVCMQVWFCTYVHIEYTESQKKRNKKIVDEKVTDLALNSLAVIQSEVLTAYSQKELKQK